MKNLERILDNAFIATRIESKRGTQFYNTEYHRPVTQDSLYGILFDNDIQIDLRDFNDLMVNYKYAKDYHTDWDSEVFLIVRKDGSELRFQNKGGSNRKVITLKKVYLRAYDLKWSDLFSEEILFETDFKIQKKHSERYYTAEPQINDNQWQLLVLLLKEIADQKKLTQNEIAELTGMQQSAISRLFLLKYKPTLETFIKVAKAIKVNFFFEDKENISDLNLAFEKAMNELGRRPDNLSKN